ncbi:MAG: hypothetical protein CSA82_00630 [Actinobacteria bacterium]|nr:MAG: hypothetical protein CSA82_00630 [Actinomycetota bacterium]
MRETDSAPQQKERHKNSLHPRFEARELPTVADTLPDSQYPLAQSAVLWKGDITTLVADAIVNAANSTLLGCMQPSHACIDRAIHTVAGPELREECAEIIRRQGQSEPTGRAQITGGYRLPARHVLHTVGPIVSGAVTDEDEAALASSYRSCLELAAAHHLRTIGLCAVSTGAFGYPKDEGARVALTTVEKWWSTHPNSFDRIVFVVFSDEDFRIYQDLLANWKPTAPRK